MFSLPPSLPPFILPVIFKASAGGMRVDSKDLEAKEGFRWVPCFFNLLFDSTLPPFLLPSLVPF